MRPENREEWLWTLSEIADRAPREDGELPDELLQAYREGRLAEPEARRVERLLVGNPGNRRRLAELAKGSGSPAPEAIRRRLLAASGRRSRRPGWVWPAGLAAAAAIALAVGWQASRPGFTPPAYEVRIAGLEERRGPAEATKAAEAFPDTVVTITATVAGRATAGVEIGVYRDAGGIFELVDELVDRRERSGAVRFQTAAALLAGPRPGDHHVYVVIARQGDLPEKVAVEPGLDPAAGLAAGGRRGVHRLTLRLLAEPSAAPSLDGDLPPDEEEHHVANRMAHLVHFPDHRPRRPSRRNLLGALQRTL